MSFLPGTQIELVNPHLDLEKFSNSEKPFALFDFDGTISLIRTGWQGIMIPMMVEILQETPKHEDEDTLTHIVTDFVTRLTGKQTIYQMIQLAEETAQRGGNALDPLDYKKEYLRRLWLHIEHRVADLKEGQRPPEAFMVSGATEILAALRERGITCYLASGTDLPYVQDEAEALGITPYFAPHIYGALDNYENFSKRMVIAQIFADTSSSVHAPNATKGHTHGPKLIAFGDGFVEIEETKAAGGIAVGVATDEVNRQGIDEWKRNRLIEAGADFIIPDFREYQSLIKYLGI